MFNEAHDALKYDNRLRARRGWVSDDELAQELGALPDSADKALEPGEEPEPKRSTKAEEPVAVTEPAAPAAAPAFGAPEPAPAATPGLGGGTDDGSFGGTPGA